MNEPGEERKRAANACQPLANIKNQVFISAKIVKQEKNISLALVCAVD